MEFLKIQKNKGIYYEPDHRSERLNLSGALALFQPTYEDLELLKQDLMGNIQDVIDKVKKECPSNMTQDEYDAWYLNEFAAKPPKMDKETFTIFMNLRGELVVLMIKDQTFEYRRAIKRIVQRQQHLLSPGKKQGGVTEAQIEQAKEYPLEDLITNRIFKATGKWIGNCHCPLPGHEGEKTPSFYIDKHNRFKCFGCSQSGDSIAFVMKRDEVNFVNAVRSLIR